MKNYLLFLLRNFIRKKITYCFSNYVKNGILMNKIKK